MITLWLILSAGVGCPGVLPTAQPSLTPPCLTLTAALGQSALRMKVRLYSWCSLINIAVMPCSIPASNPIELG